MSLSIEKKLVHNISNQSSIAIATVLCYTRQIFKGQREAEKHDLTRLATKHMLNHIHLFTLVSAIDCCIVIHFLLQ